MQVFPALHHLLGDSMDLILVEDPEVDAKFCLSFRKMEQEQFLPFREDK